MERVLLLVDDEDSIASALTRLLRRDGYTIHRANSGKGGLELLKQHKVGVIISDQRMPEMTGVEFLSKVKDIYPDTVRIVLSGYTDLNSVTDAINRGAIYKFLTKPWEDELLRANVEEAFRRYEMKMENSRLKSELQLANEKLLEANHELELRVENKTREVMRNQDILRISQEILEHLPIGVIGVATDGMIAIANQYACFILAGDSKLPLLGEMADDALPAELLACLNSELGNKEILVQLKDGRRLRCWCDPMGEHSYAQGRVLVFMLVQ